MEKRVLILFSGPRRHGNSDTLCDQFASCLSNPKERGIIYGAGAWIKGEIEGKPSRKEAFESDKNILTESSGF